MFFFFRNRNFYPILPTPTRIRNLNHLLANVRRHSFFCPQLFGFACTHRVGRMSRKILSRRIWFDLMGLLILNDWLSHIVRSIRNERNTFFFFFFFVRSFSWLKGFISFCNERIPQLLQTISFSSGLLSLYGGCIPTTPQTSFSRIWLTLNKSPRK